MPVLTPSAWAAVRAEWEIGLGSTRALAAQHGVSERAVHKRAADRRDPWRRDPEAAERARERGREAALSALACERSAAEVRIDAAALAARRDAAEMGLDAPEIRGECPQERRLARVASVALRLSLPRAGSGAGGA